MDPIVIRWGAAGAFGPPPPPATLDDVAQALDDVATGRQARPEFTLEYVSTRRLVNHDGNRSIVEVPGRPKVSVAHFLPDDETVPAGWSVCFDENQEAFDRNDPGKGRYILVVNNRLDAPFVEGNCCGAELTVRSNEIVSTEVVLSAAAAFLNGGERAPGLIWLPESLVD